MRASLKLEEFGAGYIRGYDKSGPWVARIHGFDNEYGYQRDFVRFKRDYSGASSTGNRGIWRYYALEPGLYQINQRISWGSVRRYFTMVKDDGSCQELSQSEADEWLQKNTSGLACLKLQDDV